MQYVLEINIETDGDFYFPFIPREMYWNDEYETYALKKVYKYRDVAVKDAIRMSEFLKNQMYTSRDWVKRCWDKHIDNFISALKTNNGNIRETMSGNYSGTELSFYEEQSYLNLTLPVTDEEYAMIVKGRRNIADEKVKEAILKIYKEAENESN